MSPLESAFLIGLGIIAALAVARAFWTWVIGPLTDFSDRSDD